MKEPVHRTRHPWIVGVAVAAIAGAYFYFMGSAQYPEPGPNLIYGSQRYAELDNVETRYVETEPITPDVPLPRALAVVADGIYVAGENVIVRLDENDAEIARFAIDGSPNCLAVAADGRMVIGYPHAIQVRDSDGVVTGDWEQLNTRSYLTSIAIVDEYIFVADAGNRVVLRYDWDGITDTRIGEKNEALDVPGFEVPSPYLDLAINDEDHLWIVNPGKLGLERYRHDGDIVTSWYRPTLQLEGFSGCCNPTQIAFTSEGRLVTCEKGLVRVKMYDVTSGEYEELVAGSKNFTLGQSIRDLAVDSRDRILVLDPRSRSIRVFEEKESSDGETSQPV